MTIPPVAEHTWSTTSTHVLTATLDAPVKLTVELSAYSPAYRRWWQVSRKEMELRRPGQPTWYAAFFGANYLSGRYRVQIVPGQAYAGESAEAEVRIVPPSYWGMVVRRRSVRQSVRFEGPRYARFADGRVSIGAGTARRVFAYVGSPRSPEMRLIGSAALERTTKSTTIWRYGVLSRAVSERMMRSRGRVFACYRGTMFKGMSPQPIKGCGAARIRVPLRGSTG